MNNWESKFLEDIVEINPSVNLQKGTLAKKVPMEYLLPFNKKISGFIYSKYRGGAKFLNGDVLLARITPCLENGKTAFVDILEKDEPGFGSTEFIVLRSNESVCDRQFLYYLTRSPDFRNLAIASMTGSSGRQRVQVEEISKYEALIPPLPEQKAIAGVLSALDDKIDLLHRQNQTLETLAQTLFRQWFIEEAEDQWEMGNLPDEIDFVMGLSPPGKSYNEEGVGIPMFQGKADFQFRFPNTRVFTNDPRRFAEKFDTLISVRAPVGAQNMASQKCCVGRGVAAFRYKENPNFYSYTYYKMHSLMNEIRVFEDTGTVFGSINKSDFEGIEISKPPKDLIDKFQEIVSPMDQKIFKNYEQIITLENLRDLLLPKLMSGEVRVSYDPDH